MALLSVIVPTYGRKAFLREAVTSVLSQTIPDLECIVVDDGGPEPVGEFADDRVVVVRLDRNSGPAAARNVGLERATGTYVSFLDDDDLYAERRLELGLRAIDHADIAICWRGDPTGRASRNRSLEGNVYDVILDDLVPHLGQVTLRRSFVPRFDEDFRAVEDVEWWLRVAREARVVTVPEVGYLYRTREGHPNADALELRLAASFLLLDKHKDYFSRHPRADAFRWKRIGLLAERLGDRPLARRGFLRSLKKSPAPAVVRHLLRSLLPSKRSSA